MTTKIKMHRSAAQSPLLSLLTLLGLGAIAALGCGKVVVGERPGGSSDGMGGEVSTGAGVGGANSEGKAGSPGTGGTGLFEGSGGAGDVAGQGEPSLSACEGGFSIGRDLVLLRSPFSSWTSSIESADVNGDGLRDWIVMSEGRIRTIPQRPDGSFAAQIESSVEVMDAEQGDGGPRLEVADFNGDGHVDLAVAYHYSSKLRILLGNGDGTFALGEEYATEDGSMVPRSADLNGDGLLDLIVPNTGGRSIQIFQGLGDGTFKYVWRISIRNPGSVVIGDWNGDGFPDVAVGNYDEKLLSIMLGGGDFTFKNNGVSEAGYNLTVNDSADLNDDGVLDLVIVNNGSPGDDERVGVCLGHGDGTFDAPTWEDHSFSAKFLNDSDGDGVMDAWLEAPQPDDASPINMADWNGDGAPDMAFMIQDGYAAYILRGNEDGTFAGDLSSTLDPGAKLPWTPSPWTIADATGDGVPDLLMPTTNSSVLVGEGTGDGRFKNAHEYPVNGPPGHIFAADLNRDGRIDLLTANGDRYADDNPGASLSILIADEDGGYDRTDYPFEGESLTLAIGDLDGNGTLDLVVVPYVDGASPLMKVLVGAGDGTFAPGADYPFEHNLPPELRDFNGDGILDVVAMSSTGALVMIGRGDGTFEPGVAFAPRGLIALEDLNEDGVLDAITLASTDASDSPIWLTVALGNSDVTFAAERPEIPFFSDYAKPVLARDFDADGHIDLALGNLILRGNGDGSFSCGEYRWLANGLIADLNGDGLDDVVRRDLWQPTGVEVFLSEPE